MKVVIIEDLRFSKHAITIFFPLNVFLLNDFKLIVQRETFKGSYQNKHLGSSFRVIFPAVCLVGVWQYLDMVMYCDILRPDRFSTCSRQETIFLFHTSRYKQRFHYLGYWAIHCLSARSAPHGSRCEVGWSQIHKQADTTRWDRKWRNQARNRSWEMHRQPTGQKCGYISDFTAIRKGKSWRRTLPYARTV